MPSKGNRIISFRVEPDLYAALQEEMAESGEYKTVSDWLKAVIKAAIREELDRPKAQAEPQAEPDPVPEVITLDWALGVLKVDPGEDPAAQARLDAALAWLSSQGAGRRRAKADKEGAEGGN